VLRAFGTRQPDGRVVVGSTNGSPTSGGSGGGGVSAPQQTSLRRLNVPGVRSQPQGTQLGTFGTVNGKRSTLTVTDADGTRATFAASRGSGTVYLAGERFNLVLTDGTGGAAVTVKTAGGADGRIKLGDVMMSGTLRSFTARTADLAGTLYASGSILKLTLGAVTGGTIAAAGQIASASVASLTGARVMSGAGLGADGKPGGDNADADGYGVGTIGSLRVAGAVESSTSPPASTPSTAPSTTTTTASPAARRA
jgi:hypothetical protein